MLNAIVALCLLAQDDAAVKEALERFKTGMKAQSAAGQAAAIAELAKTPHEKTFPKIAPFVMDGPKECKIAAAKGLGNFTDYKKLATPWLMNALSAPGNAKEYDVQAAIFDGLAKLQDPMALPTVHAGFRNEQVKHAKGALACAGALRQKESMDVLIELMKDIEKWLKNKQGGPYKDEKGQGGDDAAKEGRLKDIQKEIIKAFQGITKEKWTTSQEWEIWWGKRRATFEVSK